MLPSGHWHSHVSVSNILGDGHSWFISHSHLHVFWLRNKGRMHDLVQFGQLHPVVLLNVQARLGCAKQVLLAHTLASVIFLQSHIH